MTSVTIRKLLVSLPEGIGLSAFSLPHQPCYLYVSVKCHLDPTAISQSALAAGDDLPSGNSVNYSELGKRITRRLSEGERLVALEDAVDRIIKVCRFDYGQAIRCLEVEVERPKALLFARSVSVAKTVNWTSGTLQVSNYELRIHDVESLAIIGLNPHERVEKQKLSVTLGVHLEVLEAEVRQQKLVDYAGFDYKSFANEAHQVSARAVQRSMGFSNTDAALNSGQWLERSTFQTLETLVYRLLEHLLSRIPISPAQPYPAASKSEATWYTSPTIPVSVSVAKPSAIAFADCPIVSATRSLQDFHHTTEPSARESELGGSFRAWIAVGTNLGDRIGNLNRAVKQLCSQDDIRLVSTSRLYESDPMYVLDQGQFLNGAIQVITTLTPKDLLLRLKAVEKSIGRIKTIVNGPRAIDLDLLLYENEIVEIGAKGDAEGTLGEGCGWLRVPHWGIEEREFVLRPLQDIIPSDYRHPRLGCTISDLLQSLADPQSVFPVVPFPHPARPLTIHPHRPLIMGILNVTPDSFSDGEASRVGGDLEGVIGVAQQLIADGADILDIGGMSTRPGVQDGDVSVEEELSRVVPVIQALRLESNVPISIDTFRPEVAEQAILAGASCVNDVRGGRTGDMLDVMGRLGVPVILMHSRGDSTTMTTDELKRYENGVLVDVRAELEQTIETAKKAGVLDWNLTLDPGVGFAKTQIDNLRLIKGVDKVFAGWKRFGVLVGASRKGFIGNVIGEPEAKRREYGNAAITTMLAGQRVDIVRVHEPKPTRHVIDMTAAMLEA